MIIAARRSAPAEPAFTFSNGDTVVWREPLDVGVRYARLETHDKMGEGPFGLSNLNVPKATCTITAGDGSHADDVPLAWIMPDGCDGA